MYSTILFIPRMQICTIHISICMSCSLATAVARYICIMYSSGPAEVPMKEETTKLTWKLLARTTMRMKLHSLPRDTEVWTTRPANVRIEAGQVLLNKGGVYWASPSTAVPALRRMTMISRTCQLLLFCVQPAKVVQRQSAYTWTASS